MFAAKIVIFQYCKWLIHLSIYYFQDLVDQLENQRPLLADAEAMCEHLCDILSDSASKTEIKSKLNSIEKQYNNLSRKMSEFMCTFATRHS